MSLDVYLYATMTHTCPSCGDVTVLRTGELLYKDSITHNLNAMAREAGIYDILWHPDVTSASQLITPLRAGLALLRADPERFKVFTGQYDDLVSFVARYLAVCEKYPSAYVT